MDVHEYISEDGHEKTREERRKEKRQVTQESGKSGTRRSLLRPALCFATSYLHRSSTIPTRHKRDYLFVGRTDGAVATILAKITRLGFEFSGTNIARSLLNHVFSVF